MMQYLPMGEPRRRFKEISVLDGIRVENAACPSCCGMWVRRFEFQHVEGCEILKKIQRRCSEDFYGRSAGLCVRREETFENEIAGHLGIPESEFMAPARHPFKPARTMDDSLFQVKIRLDNNGFTYIEYHTTDLDCLFLQDEIMG